MLRTVLLLAFRNLRFGKKRRGHGMAGAVIAIGFSLIPLVVVLEVANGMIEGITRRFIEISTYHLQLSLYDSMNLDRQQEIARKLAEVEGVSLTIVERQGLGLIRSEASGAGVQIRAVPPDLYMKDAGLRRFFRIDSGAFDLFDEGSLLMGKAMAEKLEVKVGDRVRLLTAKTFSGRRPIYRVSGFTLTGIFSTGYQDLDKSWIYIPLSAAARILPDSRQIIGVKVEDPFKDMGAIVARLDKAMSQSERFFRIDTWYGMEENQYGSFKTTKALLVLIMVLIVVVASVNVSSAMVMIVLEKSQEIGILKGMGADPFTVTLSFIATGFAAGVFGSLIGIASGLLVAVNVNQVIRGIDFLLNQGLSVARWFVKPFGLMKESARITILDPAFYLETIPIRIQWPEIVGVAFLAVALATLASLIPARRAGRIRPMDVLRKV